MQFQVPQFIETEDKIVGPLTLRQFLIIAGGGVLIILFFFILNLGLWLFVSAIFGTISMGLAFGKLNGRPITVYISSLINNIWKPKVYVFRPEIPESRGVITSSVEYKKESSKTKEPAGERAKEKTLTTKARPLKLPQLKIPSMSGVKDLREWLATSKTAIPKREKPLPRDFGLPQKQIKEGYEILRHFTGEREIAKRIDYR